MSSRIHLTVHADMCMASGACRRTAPDVFGSTADGWVRLLDAHPTGHTNDALKAATLCPVAAIEIVDADGNRLA